MMLGTACSSLYNAQSTNEWIFDELVMVNDGARSISQVYSSSLI